MRELDAAIFDLDGTLWDTCGACAIAWNRVLRRHGIAFREIVAEDVRAVTGRPHEECIELVFRELPREQRALLVRETMAEDNRVIAELGGELYPGVVAGLERLSRVVPLFIVSNCQSGYIETFLSWSGLAALFRDFECWGNTGESKSANLGRLVARNGIASPVFVGDTEGDRVAARACGVPFAHVRYGFGACTDHDLAAASFDELVARLLERAPRPDQCPRMG